MQMQSMKCADARHLVHLAVGDDTQPEEERQLTEHLHSCSECRSYHAGMVDAMHAIERVRDEDNVDIPTGVVWSAIASQLKSRRSVNSAPERRRFNGAVAALCVCSLTLAMVTAVQNLPTNDVVPYGEYSSIPATNVSFQNGAVQRPEFGQQGQLVPIRDSNGNAAWLNPATHQLYYLQSGPAHVDQALSF
ncbi:MAG: zf-HC2 domain-containing protein [Fuerstiella sp.]|nr:zf-HC2 domain-containing protein [Fuerstiella sp.]MCP4855386.1 zf-HC2 domain-containing protein [Fuerstiella sp.]